MSSSSSSSSSPLVPAPAPSAPAGAPPIPRRLTWGTREIAKASVGTSSVTVAPAAIIAPISDRHGRDQLRITSKKDVVTDDGLILFPTVIIAGNRPGADVDAFAHSARHRDNSDGLPSILPRVRSFSFQRSCRPSTFGEARHPASDGRTVLRPSHLPPGSPSARSDREFRRGFR